MDKAWTLLELLNTTRLFLAEKGIENPRGNIEAFFMKALNLPRIELYLQHDRPITEPELELIRSFVRRRLKHEPLQLIIGTLEFCGVTLELRQGTLIPRPETEEMAVKAIELISDRGRAGSLRILDIGCGSGCLAVAIAASDKSLHVDAVDCDPVAILSTKTNAERNNVASQISCIEADLFAPSFLSRTRPPYDVIISNPPYVTESEYEQLAPEVRDWEPRHAFVAEDNGLAFYKQIAALLPTLLKPDGRVVWEFGFTQAAAMSELFSGYFTAITWYDDMAGIPRFAVGTRIPEGSLLSNQISETEYHD